MKTKREIHDPLICALLFGEAENEKRAKEIAESYKDSPYVNLMATKQSSFFQRDKDGGLSTLRKAERTLWIGESEGHIVYNVQYPRRLKRRLPKKPQ